MFKSSEPKSGLQKIERYRIYSSLMSNHIAKLVPEKLSQLNLRTPLLRFLWIACFAFWMGGFSFYGGVVVTVGSQVVAGGESEFGFVTQRVTSWLNVTGIVSIAWFMICAWIDWQDSKQLRWVHRMIFLCLMLIAIGQAILWVDHAMMDRKLDAEQHAILVKTAFRTGHKIYILTSTVIWGLCLALLALTLHVWRQRDQADCEIVSQ